MMGPSLAIREPAARERMDDPECDPRLLARTYELFPLVNAVVGGWRGVYRRDVRPRARRAPTRILDVGCGGADVARALLRWSEREGLAVEVVAIDPDPRAIAWARSRPARDGLTLRAAWSGDLVGEGARFDLVVSNHVLHHLDAAGLDVLLQDSEALLAPGGAAIHRDISRGRLAYWAFAAATALVPATHPRRSFIREDGLASIRRAYRPDELAALAPPGWHVRTGAPARIELRRERDAG